MFSGMWRALQKKKCFQGILQFTVIDTSHSEKQFDISVFYEVQSISKAWLLHWFVHRKSQLRPSSLHVSFYEVLWFLSL
jgi:hypothetical protein